MGVRGSQAPTVFPPVCFSSMYLHRAYLHRRVTRWRSYFVAETEVEGGLLLKCA